MFPTYTRVNDFSQDCDPSQPCAATESVEDAPFAFIDVIGDAVARMSAACAKRCDNCGRESTGNVLAGVHVPLCDRCLAVNVVQLVGPSLIRAIELDVAA